jgi:signal transduction histidine kinase
MGEVKMERLPVKLESLLEDIHRQASLLGQESNVQVILGLVMPAVVLGDELRLRELFLNLVDNAVKYSRPGGTVEISLTTHLNQVKLVITDQGIGISPEDQKRIFDRFYRTDDARAHTKKGTGLGLAICAWIVESHHGRVYGNPAAGDFTLLKTFNTVLIGLSFLLATVLCRDFRLPCRMFHFQSLSLSISKEDL